MSKINIKQLDSCGEIYAAIDERGCIIGTGTKEVCEFLMMLANHELETVNKVDSELKTTRDNVRSAIDI